MNYPQLLHIYETGLRLVFVKTSGFHTAKFKLAVEVGSEDEKKPYGLAHLLEHSTFKGTDKYNQEEISEKFNELSAEVDASTSSEFTVYKANFPKRNLKEVLSLYASLLKDSIFDEYELQKEKQVIIEEILMHEDIPDQLAFDNLVKCMYSDCGIGNDIAGEVEYLQQMTSKDVKSFHDKYYHSKNFLVSVVGDFEFEEVKKVVDEIFSKPFAKKSVTKTKTWSPVSKVKPTTIFAKKEINQSNILLGFRSLPYENYERMKLGLIGFILGGSMSSRLFKKIRNELSLCYSIFAFDMNYKNNGFLGISLATTASNQEKAIKAVNDEIQKVLEQGVTDEEFETAKNLSIDKHLMLNDYPNASLSFLSYTNRLQNEQEILNYLKSITKEQAMECFKRHISLSGEFVSIVSPKK